MVPADVCNVAWAVLAYDIRVWTGLRTNICNVERQ